VNPDHMAAEMAAMEADFRDALRSRARALEFRTAQPASDLAEAISREARFERDAAALVVDRTDAVRP